MPNQSEYLIIRGMNRNVLCGVFACLSMLATHPVFAVSSADVSLNGDDLLFRPPHTIVNQSNQIYIMVTNKGSSDVEGIVRVFDDGILIGEKPYSVKAASVRDEVWVAWTPKTIGNHAMKIEAVNDASTPDTTPADNIITVSRFVDQDTDHDGIPDVSDPDDDNDGVSDAQDEFPTDAARSRDTDHDGIDDKIDTDADNDGLYNFQEKTLGTHPLKYDTDGDKVGDKQDAFPLDPKRSVPALTPAAPSNPVSETITERASVLVRALASSRDAPVTQDQAVGIAPRVAGAVSPPVQAQETTTSVHGVLSATTTTTTTTTESSQEEKSDINPTAQTALFANTPENRLSVTSSDDQDVFPIVPWLVGLAIIMALGGLLFFSLDRRRM